MEPLKICNGNQYNYRNSYVMNARLNFVEFEGTDLSIPFWLVVYIKFWGPYRMGLLDLTFLTKWQTQNF